MPEMPLLPPITGDTMNQSTARHGAASGTVAGLERKRCRAELTCLRLPLLETLFHVAVTGELRCYRRFQHTPFVVVSWSGGLLSKRMRTAIQRSNEVTYNL